MLLESHKDQGENSQKNSHGKQKIKHVLVRSESKQREWTNKNASRAFASGVFLLRESREWAEKNKKYADKDKDDADLKQVIGHDAIFYVLFVSD